MEEIRFKLGIKRIWACLLLILLVNIYVVGNNNQIDYNNKKYTSEEYAEYIGNVRLNAKKMAALSVMSSGYAIENIRKTLADFSNINTSWNDDSNTDAVQELLDSNALDIEILCFILLMIVFVTEEKRNGLWYLKHSCKSGRGRSSINTIIAIGIWCVIGLLALNAETYIITGIKNGFTDLWLPIQAVGGHQTVVKDISVFAYLIEMFFVKALGYFFVAMLFMVALYLIRRETIAIIGMVAVIGISRGLYLGISLQGQWAWLKVLNPWMIFYRDDALRTYSNLNIFNHAVSLQTVVVAMASIVSMLLIASYIMIQVKIYPNDSRDSSLSQKIKVFFSKVLFAGGFARLEHYKILSVRTGQIGILLFIIFLTQNNLNGKITFGDNQQYKNELYKMIENTDLSSGVEILEREQNKNTEIIKKYEAEKLLLEIGSAESKAISEAIKEIEKKNEAVNELMLYNITLMEKKNNGIDVSPINDIGYRFMFTASGKNMQYTVSFILLIFIVIIVAPGMAQERKKKIDKLVHSSTPSDRRFYLGKLKAYYVWVIVASLICSLHEIYLIQVSFGFGDIGKSIQSLSVFQQSEIDMKILTIIILDIVLKMLVCIVIASVVFAFSVLFNNAVAAIIVATIIFVVPSWLRMVGVNIYDGLCLINYLCSYQRIKIWF